MSVRVRLTLWYSGMLATLLVAYAAGVYAWTRHDALRRIDAEVVSDLEEIESIVGINSAGEFLLPSDLEDQDPDELKLVALFDADGELQLRLPPDQAPTTVTGDWQATTGHPITATRTDGTRVRVQRTTVDLDGLPFCLEVGHSIDAIDAELAQLALVLLLCIPIGVSLAAAAGWFLAGRALAPVDRLAEQARRITAERLSERLPIAHPNDELGRLAAAFNEMLERLDASFEQLRRFTADASHELRTPLTAMRLVGENALRHGNLPVATREVVGSMIEEVDRLARLVDDLLQLARADSGQEAPRLEPCDLATIARDVTEQLGVLAEEKRLVLHLEAPATAAVLGHPVLLRQALQNLIDNAIRHSPEGSEVRVAIVLEADAVRVTVADHGSGISAEHRTRIFERFYRVDAARARAHGGAGLGLAIAKWIVDAHRGRIDVIPTNGTTPGHPPGATFRIELPADRVARS